jgi:hypothetical protein
VETAVIGDHDIEPEPDEPDDGLISLRDYFAAAALQGLRLTLPPLTSSERVATLAYLDADAMLAERDKPKGTK